MINKIEEIDNRESIRLALEKYKNLCYICKINQREEMCLCKECYNKLWEVK